MSRGPIVRLVPSDAADQVFRPPNVRLVPPDTAACRQKCWIECWIERPSGWCRPALNVGVDRPGAQYAGVVDLMGLIDVRPGVRSGKPCFVGTRITVYDVLEYLASGMTTDEIVADFPELTADHVRAALAFAAMRERRLATPA